MTKPSEHRAGYVALVGRPNVGKSTLLNALIGQKLSIVTPKPQTTRDLILAIKNLPGAQIIFRDTPGLHSATKEAGRNKVARDRCRGARPARPEEGAYRAVCNRRATQTGGMDRRRGWQDYFDQPPRGALNRAMVDRAQSVMLDSDLLLFLTEAAEAPDRPLKHADTEVLSRLRELGRPVLLVLTKVDRTRNKVALLPQIEGLSRELPFEAVVPTSAVKLEGLGQLLDEIVARLPVAPAYYPEDVLTNLPEKFFVAELIREQILLHTRAEIPYSAAVVVDGFDESGPIVRIQSTIHVERPSQKRIVIGRQGEMLKQIGTQARKQIEHLLERRVHLELWVRVTPEWTKDPAAVQRLSAEPVSTGIER